MSSVINETLLARTPTLSQVSQELLTTSLSENLKLEDDKCLK